MSEEKDSGEKKHKPSARQLEKFRKEGDFLRAKEFYSASTLVFSLLILFFIAGLIYQNLFDNFTLVYKNLDVLIRDDVAFWGLFHTLAFSNFTMLFPVYIGIFIFFLLLVHLFGGLSFASSLLAFKGSRLNPIANIGRIFTMRNLVELLKSIFKISLFLAILFYFIKGHQQDIISLVKIDDTALVERAYVLLKDFFVDIMFGIVLLAIADALINFFQYQQKTMMTTQQMKDEHKESEGNPEIKRKIRQAQQAAAIRRLQQDMPTATVVITNPTHYAVALRYTDQLDSAPKIIARGIDHMALNIRTLAIKHGIPIYEGPELARAIYYTGKEGAMIHPELYMAVAIVLSYIMQLKNYQMGIGQMPQRVDDLNIPEEFKFKAKE